MANKRNDYPNNHLLIDSFGLERHMNAAETIVIDARPAGYEKGHVPGAYALPSARLKAEDGVRAIDAANLAHLLRERGIGPDTRVIVYDEGDLVHAARVFYVLEYYGHWNKASVLHGGFAAWRKEGRPVSAEIPPWGSGTFVAVPDTQRQYDKDQVHDAIRDDAVVLLDARSVEEYRGENLRNNSRGGHIPHSVHLEWIQALDRDSGDVPALKKREQLEELFHKTGVVQQKTIVPFCHSNGRGAHTYFVLRLLGFPDIRPYEGSWAEWGNAEDTEIEQEVRRGD